MATAINDGTFSFYKEELKDWSKVIHVMTFANPELNSLHEIEEGIKYDTQIVFSQSGGLIGKKVGANCTPNEITGVTLSEKVWQPVFEDFRLKHCSTDVNQQDKLVNQMAKMNPDFYNVIDGSQKVIGDFLVASILQRWNERIIPKVWFSDTLADTIANGGVLTNGTDKTYFNTFNGLFKQIFTDATISAKYKTTIAKNSGASYVLQTLDSGDALAALKSVYTKADLRLRSLADAKFYVTQSIYDGYMNDLETLQNVGVGNTMITENGQMKLTYRGIEVVAIASWDREIDAYQNNGTKWNLPHRIVLSTPNNLRVGTLAQGDFGNINAFYDQYHNVNVIDGVYSIDAKMLEAYKVSVAY